MTIQPRSNTMTDTNSLNSRIVAGVQAVVGTLTGDPQGVTWAVEPSHTRQSDPFANDAERPVFLRQLRQSVLNARRESDQILADILGGTADDALAVPSAVESSPSSRSANEFPVHETPVEKNAASRSLQPPDEPEIQTVGTPPAASTSESDPSNDKTSATDELGPSSESFLTASTSEAASASQAASIDDDVEVASDASTDTTITPRRRPRAGIRRRRRSSSSINYTASRPPPPPPTPAPTAFPVPPPPPPDLVERFEASIVAYIANSTIVIDPDSSLPRVYYELGRAARWETLTELPDLPRVDRSSQLSAGPSLRNG